MKSDKTTHLRVSILKDDLSTIQLLIQLLNFGLPPASITLPRN